MKWSPEQQKAISERGKNLLVSAAAGSGKTAVLVERIKGLLLQDGVSLSEMLVVTFSNAAAAEMREKIVIALTKEMEETESTPEKQRFLRKQLNEIHKANISTFHAFAMEVIRRYFYLIEIEPNFKICDEGQKTILQDRAIEELFFAEFAEQRPSFLHFLDCYASAKNEQDAKDMILSVYQFIQSMPEPFSWLEQAVEGLNLTREEFEKGEACAYLMEDIQEKIRLSLEYTEKIQEELLGAGVESLAKKAEMDLHALEALETAFREKGLGCLEELPINWQRFVAAKDEKEDYALMKDRIGDLRSRAKDLLDKIKKQYGLKTIDESLEEMRETLPQAQELCYLVHRFEEIFREKKEERGVVDFSDIEHYALRILRYPEAAEEYRKKFQYIFIDEYQDSNVIQEELIGCIKRPDNLFMVGDVKQSIYKFRLAEPEIFLNKYELFRRTKETERNEKIDLNLNFRCKGSIIHATNHIFSQIMTKRTTGITYDEAAALNQGLEYSGKEDYPAQLWVVETQLEEGRGQIDTEIQEMKAIELEATVAANIVKEAIGKPIYDCKAEKIRSLQKKDIVILLRGIKSSGEVYAKALAEQGIPSFMDNSDGYLDAIEIQVFLNLLRIIDNKRQDIPLLSVLRSSVFGFAVDQLAEIRGHHRKGSYLEAVEAYALDGKTEALGKRCVEVLEKLEIWNRKASFMPLPQFLWELINETGYGNFVSAIPGGAQRQANLNAMVDKAIQYESSQAKGIFGFIRYIEALQKGKVKIGQVKMIGENDDVVRIMTIHKSKGLEFPFVLIGRLGAKFGGGRVEGKVVCHKDLGIGLRWVDAKNKSYRKPLLKQLIDRKSAEDDMAEEIRILYVAFTRAMDQLVLLGTKKTAQAMEETENLFLQEDIEAVKCYLDFIFPCLPESKLQTIKVGRSDLSVQRQRDDQRKEELKEGFLFGYPREGSEEDRREVFRRLSFRYPREEAQKRKTKYTVSSLAKEEQEKEEEVAFPRFDCLPRFLEIKHRLNGAQRGTIYHKVMEQIPFDRSWKRAEIQAFIRGLVAREILTEEEEKALNPIAFERFFQSELGKRAIASKEVYRELPFNLKKEKEGESILVQGTIDCYFEEEDGVVLVDYKSNFIDDTQEEAAIEELIGWYRPQLLLYQEALTKIKKKKVKEMYLYLFALGKEVRVE